MNRVAQCSRLADAAGANWPHLKQRSRRRWRQNQLHDRRCRPTTEAWRFRGQERPRMAASGKRRCARNVNGVAARVRDCVRRSRRLGSARRIGAGSAAKRYTVARRRDGRGADRDPGRHAQLAASAAACHHAAAAKQDWQRRTAGTDARRCPPGRARCELSACGACGPERPGRSRSGAGRGREVAAIVVCVLIRQLGRIVVRVRRHTCRPPCRLRSRSDRFELPSPLAGKPAVTGRHRLRRGEVRRDRRCR